MHKSGSLGTVPNIFLETSGILSLGDGDVRAMSFDMGVEGCEGGYIAGSFWRGLLLTSRRASEGSFELQRTSMLRGTDREVLFLADTKGEELRVYDWYG